MSTVDSGFEWGKRTYVMGVINVTPDSFSDGGMFHSVESALSQARRLVEAGADILDIGGESTRPYSQPISLEEELKRVVPVIEAIRKEMDVVISIDTTKAKVAEAALDVGANVVNDVSGLRFDPAMVEIVASRGVPVILMHMKGTPRDMQENPVYEDAVGEIMEFLQERIEFAEARGVAPEKIWIDPGIGFGKRLEDNIAILKGLDRFKGLGRPLLLGPSRKAFLGAITGIEVPADRDIGTTAVVALAVAKGVDVVRVHNVEYAVQAVKVADALCR